MREGSTEGQSPVAVRTCALYFLRLDPNELTTIWISKGEEKTMIYGYGRVSSNQQDTTLQEDAFHRAGVTNVITEKWKSKGTRPALHALLAKLGPGDTLVVWKLDRVGRSLLDLLNILSRLEKQGCSFRSLTEGIDTTTHIGRLMAHLIGAFAEYEWYQIRERCMAGQRAAMERGVHCGRPRHLSPKKEAQVCRLYASGKYTLHALAVRFDVSDSVIKRAVYRLNKPNSSSLK